MGNASTAFGDGSVAIGRGASANASGSVAIGYHNGATGINATAIGDHNFASGNYSTSFGYYSNTNGHTGSFIWADASSLLTTTNSTADNQFMVKASGGTIFYSNSTLTSGVMLAAGGGAWATLSDRRMKENLKEVDGNEILKKLDNIDVTTWNYKSQSEKIRHAGPMAQDFFAAFGLGESDTTITTVDIDGVNMAAIKALIKKTEELNKEVKEVELLKAKLLQAKNENELLEARVTAMEKAIEKNSRAFSLAPTK
jgi:hypothetical protein